MNILCGVIWMHMTILNMNTMNATVMMKAIVSIALIIWFTKAIQYDVCSVIHGGFTNEGLH